MSQLLPTNSNSQKLVAVISPDRYIYNFKRLKAYTFVYCNHYKAKRMQSAVSKSSNQEGYFTGSIRSSKHNSSKKNDKTMYEAMHQLWKSKYHSISDGNIKVSGEEEEQLLFLPDYAVKAEAPSMTPLGQISTQLKQSQPTSHIHGLRSKNDDFQANEGKTEIKGFGDDERQINLKSELKPLQQSQNIDLRSSRAVIPPARGENTKEANKNEQYNRGNLPSIVKKEEETNCNNSIIYFQKSQSENENGPEQAERERGRQSPNDSIQTHVERGQILNATGYSMETITDQIDGKTHQNEDRLDDINVRGIYRENRILPAELTAPNSSDEEEKGQLVYDQIPISKRRKENLKKFVSLQHECSYKWPETSILGLVFDCCAGWLFKRKLQASIQHLFTCKQQIKEKSDYHLLPKYSPVQQQRIATQRTNFNRHMFLKSCELKIKQSKEHQALYQRSKHQDKQRNGPQAGKVRDKNNSLSTIREQEIQESVTEVYEQLKQLNAGYSESKRYSHSPKSSITFNQLSDRKYREGQERAQLFRVVTSTPLAFNHTFFPKDWDHYSGASKQQRQYQEKMARRLSRIENCELGRQRAQILKEDQLRREARRMEEYVQMEVPAGNRQRGFKVKVPSAWNVQFL